MYLNSRWIMIQYGKSWFVGTVVAGKFWVYLSKASNKRHATVAKALHGIDLELVDSMKITIYGRSVLEYTPVEKLFVPPRQRPDITEKPRVHRRVKINGVGP